VRRTPEEFRRLDDDLRELHDKHPLLFDLLAVVIAIAVLAVMYGMTKMVAP
jgi:hypothetical protein